MKTKITRINNKFEKIKEKVEQISKSNKNKKDMKNDFEVSIEELIQTFRDQQKLISELMTEREKNIKNLAQNSSNNNNNKVSKTYAEITKQNMTNNLEKKSKEVLLVYPNEQNKDMSSDQLKQVIKKKIDLKTIKNIGINSIRKVRNNGIIIEVIKGMNAIN